MKDLLEINALSSLGMAKQSHVLRLFPEINGPSPLPLINSDSLPDDCNFEHNKHLPAPAVSVIGLTNHEVIGQSFIRSNTGAMFSRHLFLPNYLLGLTPETADPEFRNHLFGAAVTGQVNYIDLDTPCFVLLHSHLNYGHFLLEVFPKLFIIGMLKEMGVRFPVLMHHGAPAFVKEFVNYVVPDEDLIWMWPPGEIVRSPCFLVPSMMQDGYSFNPAINLAIDYFTRRVLVGAPPPLEKRIYLSRRKLQQGWHKLENEVEVEELMAEIGFEVISPEMLSVREQIFLYASTTSMISEYGSASHNALFCPCGSRSLVINAINALQSRIATVRRQLLAIQMPSDGKFRTDSRVQCTFTVNISEMRTLCHRVFG